MPRDTEDEIAEANYLARKARRERCECEDLPLYCPGPAACPYASVEPEEIDADDDA